MTAQEQEFNTNPGRPGTISVGARLKARREQLGMTIEQAAQQLKLTKTQVAAIERDAYDTLPGNTFARGFVRNYARLLEIDPAPLLDDLVAWLPVERVQTALPKVHEEEAFAGRRNVGKGIQFYLSVAVSAVLSAGVGMWYLKSPASPQLDTQPALTVASEASSVLAVASEVASNTDGAAASASAASEVTAAASAPAPQATAQPTLAPTPAPTAAPAPTVAPAAPAVASKPAAAASAAKAASRASAVVGNGELRLVAEADTWVQVFDAHGNKLLSEIVKQGESRAIGGAAPYKLKIGNAPKTKVYLRGKAIDLSTYTKTDVATLELQ
ncbi:cytoskeleton protein RodZ [Andreprevotia lacus DSM 23236]|jgi:cytoskeleton protein RodZ|uniref:Cytoskeleton protein RodZ n=1 Tax=Andreprevotia lacus DSM 23236 TaxID=1121001 RepID=A0A1W1XLQ9_9NEIS|nr:helix-turn-helix domain-containing protein [Andreprevotia lacus]SMC24883.1 cytoskeleton protein RodZ [Andreprevotia lacus DSM 23236]